jgi:hypothetical protein
MFALFCGAWQYVASKPQFNVAILGPDDSGKTVRTVTKIELSSPTTTDGDRALQTLLENLKALYLGYSPLSPSQIMASQYITLCYD